MRRVGSGAVGALWLAAAVFPGLLPAASTRTELLRRLEGDVGRAMSNASLSEGQIKKLTQARGTILESASRRKGSDRYERNLLQSAIKDVQSAFKNKKAFRAEDRKAVLDDLEQVRRAGILAESRARQGGRGPMSPWPFPNPRTRYPRRLPLSGAPSV
ncbi:MAG: hypothetical protein Q8N47_23730 [Bryobacterales bacterium]|nr:hypothetical protein [Bryobacterales bacterium]